MYLDVRENKDRSRLLLPAAKLRDADSPPKNIYKKKTWHKCVWYNDSSYLCSQILSLLREKTKDAIYIRKQKEVVIRTPRLTPEVNGEDYYHQILLLHLP